jgi:hypothetical protein
VNLTVNSNGGALFLTDKSLKLATEPEQDQKRFSLLQYFFCMLLKLKMGSQNSVSY